MGMDEYSQLRALEALDDTGVRIGFFRGEIRRRRAGMRHVLPQIERNLRMLAASPLLSSDAGFHSLLHGIALAGTLEDFADRFADLHRYVSSRASQAAGGDDPGGHLAQSAGDAAALRSGRGAAGGGRQRLRL
ncbi:hypothetical protein FIV00_25965 [Labrenzia sp. THAF82]|uniref:hypothetical protein n=1 Tax=Labrenzia sp. THAF82 TaxID=2587861 RepID=UPI001267ED6C|nr:hypothetical protein [Labrenzia sp. THAF82]QFT33969.1 hypothetical protein FIV00_25965 [Labrenzia sp. THAF82]